MANNAERAGLYQSMQVLLLVFSLIFFFIIAYGYYNLLIGAGVFVALLFGSVIATFAWFLARVVGTGGGIRQHPLFFAGLLVVSAAGVYNSLMLYLEGGTVLADTASSSQESFTLLQSNAEKGMSDSGAAGKINQVHSLSESLFSEIRNPLNCGQGPEARRLIGELQKLLPGFTPLTNPARDCGRNEQLVQDYRDRIAALIERANWNDPDLTDVISGSEKARRALEDIRSDVTSSYSPLMLRRVLTDFEAQDANFRELRFKLGRHVSVRDLPATLPLEQAQSLGNAFKLLNLFFGRLDRIATYAYLLIAVTFDLFMVKLFKTASENRVRRRPTTSSFSGAL